MTNEKLREFDGRLRSNGSKTELHKDRILDLVRLQREVRDEEESNSRLEAQRFNAVGLLSGNKEQLTALETMRFSVEAGGRQSIDLDWNRELYRSQQALGEQRSRYKKAIDMVRDVGLLLHTELGQAARGRQRHGCLLYAADISG